MRIMPVCFRIALLMSMVAPVFSRESGDSCRWKFKQMEKDVPSLYLINGLYLTSEQAGKLGSLQNKAARIDADFLARSRKLTEKRQKDIAKEVNEIVRVASRGKKLDPQKVKGSLRGKRLQEARREVHDLRRARYKQLSALADDVYALLTEGQRKIVDGFIPCFIPSRDFREPERVGQAAEDTSFVEGALKRLRKVSDDLYGATAVDRALDKLVPYAMEKRHIRYSEEARQAVWDELASNLTVNMEKIRGLGDADFELEKSNLARKVLPMEKGDGKNAEAIRWKVQHYMLNTGIRDVMFARANSKEAITQASPKMKEGEVVKPIDAGKAIRTASILSGLDLTREQADSVLGIVKKAIGDMDELEKEIQAAMSDAMVPYGTLRNQLMAGQAKPEAERIANRSHQRVLYLLKEKTNEAMIARERDLDRLLSAKQVIYLAADPKDILKQERAMGEGLASSMAMAKRTLSDARRMSGQEFERGKTALCRKFVLEYIRQAELDPKSVDVEAEVKRGLGILELARKSGSADYSGIRESLASELCPKRTTPRPATYTAKYVKGKPLEEASPTSQLLFSATACEILERIAGKQ